MKVLQRRLLLQYGFFRVEPHEIEKFEYAHFAYEIGKGRRGQCYYLIVPDIEDGDEISILSTASDGAGCSTPFTSEFFDLICRLKEDGIIR